MNRYYQQAIIISISLLLSVASFAIENFSYNNNLVEAVDENNIDQVISLIKNGTSIDARGKFGITPLMRAAYKGNEKIARILLDLGADAEAIDIGGATALHIAARMGKANIVKILLLQNIDPDVTDNEGWTPLMRASAVKMPISVELLLNANASPIKKNKLGQSALTQAILNNNMPVFDVFVRRKIIENIDHATRGELLNLAELKNNQKIISVLENNSTNFIANSENLSRNMELKLANNSTEDKLKTEDKNSQDKELVNIAKEDLAIITDGDFIKHDKDNIIENNSISQLPAETTPINQEITNTPLLENKNEDQILNSSTSKNDELVIKEEVKIDQIGHIADNVITIKKPRVLEKSEDINSDNKEADVSSIETNNLPLIHKKEIDSNIQLWIETPYYNISEANFRYDQLMKLAELRNYRFKLVKPYSNNKISAIQIGPVNNTNASRICDIVTNSSGGCNIVKNIQVNRYNRE